MNIKPIKCEADHKAALQRIDALWGAEDDTPEGDELDVLVTLVEAYEEEEFPIDPPDPIEAILFRMEQAGLVASDLVQYLGTRSRVSEILNKQRKLNITMIRKLNSGLNIPLDCLVKDYQLTKQRKEARKSNHAQ